MVVQAGVVHGGVHVRPSRGSGLPVPRQLPFDVPDFTGRVEELRRLDGSVTGDGTVAITLVSGAPGVGKTAVAVRWAYRVSDRFPDGQLYVNLRGFGTTDPMTAHEALDAFVRAFDVAPERIPTRVDELAALYRSLLATRRVLVVLDNAVDVDQVGPLLPGSATCAVVITSRNRLAGLVAGTGARRVVLEGLSPVDSVALLTAAVGVDRLDAEPEAAGELARLCAGLPLALRIAGERVAGSRHHTLTDLVDQLAAEQDRLDLLAGVDDQVDVVRAAFSWSYRKLPALAAGVFRRVGWHAGPEFGVAAAAALADLPEPEARRVLGTLVGANLLTEVGRERYRFHDLVRLYAVERAESEEAASDRIAAVRRLLEWYLRMADAADHRLTRRSYCVALDHADADDFFSDQRQAVRWCEFERANLMAAIRQAADSGEHSIAWRLPIALWGFFFLNKHMEDWTSALTIGLASARRTGDRRGEAWSLHSLRETRFSMHQTSDVSEYPREALAIFLDIGDHWGIREALSNLGYAHRLRGELDQALVHLDEALSLWRQTEDLWGRAWTLHSLGETYLDLHRWDDAARALGEALDLFTRIGHRQAEGFALSNLGYLLLGTERFASAIDQFRRAMAVHDEVGDHWSASRSLTGLGTALHATGAIADARSCWREALAISEDLHDWPTAQRVRALLAQ
ncbi:ATP-binding protein [Saccharothrix saharensis]|uniref:ATP-binding protein n=1 Tax=Saccharothrix saharensis TaxID=571190 RepID=UPI001B86460E|nr:tetratricopeptide repeat protein [Saccharothrix saharensis]